MAMSRYTGNTTMSACELCGTETKHAEVELGFKNPTIRWRATPHDAPCGAHCFGGGITPEDYENGPVHGHPFRACLVCGATPQQTAESRATRQPAAEPEPEPA
jgi:hypothetical protein